MNEGKIFWCLLIILIIVAEIGPYIEFDEDSNLNPFDYARITDIDYTARVIDERSASNLLVTERITFDIHAASKDNGFWELWRDLPEDNIDGLKVNYQVLSVKEIFDDGSYIEYEQSPKLYWDDYDYISPRLGPGKWYHSEGPYNEDLGQYECLMLYVDNLYREKVTFEIQYLMYNAAFKYNDCSELYLSMYSGSTIKYLNSLKGQILLSQKDMPQVGDYEYYTFGTNKGSFEIAESDTLNRGYHTFYFDLDKDDLKFKPYNEYVEFALISFGEDKHKFTDYGVRNIYSGEDALEEIREEEQSYQLAPARYAKIKVVVLIVCAGFAIYIIMRPIKLEKKYHEKYNFYEPTMQMMYFRDIPSDLDPCFAAHLVFCKHKQPKKEESDGYSAIMLSLVRKKYIELAKIDDFKDWTFNNVKIIVKNRPEIPTIYFTDRYNSYEEYRQALEAQPVLPPLTKTEKHYFNLINRYAVNAEISMNTFQSKVSIDFENTNSFLNNMKNAILDIGIEERYYQKANYKEPRTALEDKSFWYAILGVLMLTVVNGISYFTQLDLAFGGFTILGIAYLCSSVFIRKMAKRYILLTQFGEDEYVKWRGLYEFLNSETLMSERTVIELPIWEQYLVYATAFGISDKVIKALQIRCPDFENSEMLQNPYYRSTSFHHTYSSHFSHATRTARHSYSSYHYSSGGYGGGFGYGGGGRGGGGGRRWSLI